MVSKDAPNYIEDININNNTNTENPLDNIYFDVKKCLLGDIINYNWNDRTLLIKENIIRCYMCRKYIIYNKSCMCTNCFCFNNKKKNEQKDLFGQIAIVTGARVKVGYHTALKLLRCNAKVIATSRFPKDTFDRYSKELDFNKWKDNLLIYALDFRHLPSVHKFIDHIISNYKKIDILINNAAQTVKRPPQYYKHLVNNELNNIKNINKMIKYDYSSEEKNIKMLDYIIEKNDKNEIISSDHLPLSVALSQQYIGDEKVVDDYYFPIDEYDDNGQQIDLRRENSWNAKIDDLSTVELVEVQVINNIVPSLLISKLKHLMINDEPNSKHIINVTSIEGMFNITKGEDHPHTNMSKAALNQLTKCLGSSFIKNNIFVNSVDVGWSSSSFSTYIKPPLTNEDSVARILDPIFTEKFYGKLLKDFKVCEW